MTATVLSIAPPPLHVRLRFDQRIDGLNVVVVDTANDQMVAGFSSPMLAHLWLKSRAYDWVPGSRALWSRQ